MLKIKNLHVYVGEKHILGGIDLLVRPGEIHAVMGPNGSGKTTLAYALMGHPAYKPGNPKSRKGTWSQRDFTSEIRNPKQIQNSKSKIQRATITLDGESLLGKTPDQRARMGLFLAFQYPVSAEGISVGNFLRQIYKASHGKSKADVVTFRRRVIREAQRLGLRSELLGRSLNENFSGGERKKMEILQMVALKPKYAILDETDSGLDIDAIKTVAGGLKQIIQENINMGIILITHHQRILRFIKPDFVHVLIDGRIVKSGGRELAMELERKGYREWIATSD